MCIISVRHNCRIFMKSPNEGGGEGVRKEGVGERGELGRGWGKGVSWGGGGR